MHNSSRYAAYDRELLAIYMAVQYFRKMVEGRTLVIDTDHKPLIHALKKLDDSLKATPMRIRHTFYISQFGTSIEYLSGSQNVVADALSRIAEINCPEVFDYKELAR